MSNVLPMILEAIVIPLPKAGKEITEPGSYRTILLASALCKLVEGMINGYLFWYHESNRLHCNGKCGFMQGQSSID